MTIGIDIRHLARGPSTGIARVTCALIEVLARLAPEDRIRVFYTGRRIPPTRVLSWPDTFANLTLTRWQMPNRLFDFAARGFRFPKLDTVLGSVDIFLSPHALVAPLRASRRVVVVHDLSFVVHPEFFSPASRRWHRLMDIRQQAREAACLVVPSRATSRDLRRFWGIPEERIRVIPWGTDSSSKDTSESIPTAKFPGRLPGQGAGLTPDSRFVLYLGAVEARKNVVGLVRAYALLLQESSFRDFRLVIAGPEGWKGAEAVREAQMLGIGPSVAFVGYVSEEEKQALYRRASLFVYPSLYEGFGLPVLEAMAAGVPVVTSAASSLPEVAGDAALLVDPRQPEDIAIAMREILTDRILADTLAARGRARAAQFTWEKTGQAVLE
ncbi:MAG: glycosyltransferase family 4 protein, partial [Candidatus Terrybacteria bacterium]|nr:glycosyltransferase family 4 protein [Candidatus Terrybacteria bacterium]